MWNRDVEVMQGLNAGKPVLKTEVNSLPCVWVNELMTGDGRAWNRELIQNLLTEASCKAILEIKGLDPAARDKWVWTSDVKAYAVAVKKKILSLDMPGCSSNINVDKKARMRCWNLRVKVCGLVVGARFLGSVAPSTVGVDLLWFVSVSPIHLVGPTTNKTTLSHTHTPQKHTLTQTKTHTTHAEELDIYLPHLAAVHNRRHRQFYHRPPSSLTPPSVVHHQAVGASSNPSLPPTNRALSSVLSHCSAVHQINRVFHIRRRVA
ncbi:fatty acid hydroxylase superfamily [Striga asiatica]|uniref:Fatty acid hydroxylase superfamily n=1 Tax=Striga asiatica TaxID=4170 RepID=A0A5A7PKD6_STRAF|nr:fatty acid hydroxylase superfamily [Striga asiatica]